MAEKKSKKMDAVLSVKKHIVLAKKGKKFLLLRLAKAKDEKLTSVTVKVIEHDKNGKNIGTQILQCSRLAPEAALQEFSLAPKTQLFDECATCDVEITAAYFGNYGYVLLSNGEITTDYLALDSAEKTNEAIAATMYGRNVTVFKKRRYKLFPFVAACSFAAIFLCCIITVFCINSFASTVKTFKAEGVSYAFVNNENTPNGDLVITGYDGKARDIVIPAVIDGHDVVEIKYGAFEDADNLKTVTIKGQKTISQGAFLNCKGLEKVNLGTAVRVEIGAFMNCTSLKEVDFGKVKEIEAYAFYNCTKLQAVTAANLEKVGDYAFYGSGLENIELTSNNTMSLGSRCFGGLKANSYTARIVGSINYNYQSNGYFSAQQAYKIVDENNLGGRFYNEVGIGDYFYNSVTVTNLSLENYFTQDNDIASTTNVEGYLAFKKLFDAVPTKIENVVIGKMDYIPSRFCQALTTLKTFRLRQINTPIIEDSAFAACTNLTEISLPETITTLGNHAFSGSGISSFSFANIANLGEGVFSGCSKLERVDFGSSTSLQTIPTNTFSECASLSSISIPDEITSIGQNAFYHCVELKAFSLGEGVSQIGAGMLDGCDSLESIKMPIIPITNATSTQYWLRSLFKANTYDLATSSIPSTLKKIEIIGSYAIPDKAFYNCDKLEEIVINDEITEIGNYAFGYCSSLKSIVVPSSVNTIGQGAFTFCNELKEMTLPFVGGSLVDSNGMSYLFSSETDDVELPKIEKITILGGAALPANAFSNISTLSEIILPSTLTGIGTKAFEGCSKLTEITIPEDTYLIADQAFTGCYRLTEVVNLSALDIVAGSLDNGEVARYAIRVTDGTQTPIKTAIIGSYTFEEGTNGWYLTKCTSTEKAILPESFEFDGATITSYKLTANAFSESPISSLTINGGVTEIADYAFSECKNLTEVTLKGITAIGNYAFSECNMLNSISLNEGILTISEKAFYNTNLTSVILPSSLTSIAAHAIDGTITSLKNIYFGGNQAAWTALSTALVLPSDCNVYYYSKCIHELEQNLWRYTSGGAPTTLPSMDANGNCSECGLTRLLVNSTTMITNSMVDSTSFNYQTSSATYRFGYNTYWKSINSQNNTATITVTADRDVKVTFKYGIYSSVNADYLTISVNDGLTDDTTLNGGYTEYYAVSPHNYEVELTAGKTLTITYSKYSSSSTRSAYIMDFYLEYIAD